MAASHKPGKSPDRRPARARYWAANRLAVRKISRLMRSGYSFKAAYDLWTKARKGRVKGAHPSPSSVRRALPPSLRKEAGA